MSHGSCQTNGSMTASCNEMDYKSELLLDTVALCDLSQFNPIPNNNNKILDLALSTSGNMTITNEKTLLKHDKHHPALRIDFSRLKFP
ncbi:unnamed protein product [Parnassius apollo]|uniref:(apollo) hypothetical protein n=1 Tax=Parnassius apollo TaxID=110799 RepID=A0A8S3WYH1_PARAO|nr:unnamed protein product [Parnassius apollo]